MTINIIINEAQFHQLRHDLMNASVAWFAKGEAVLANASIAMRDAITAQAMEQGAFQEPKPQLYHVVKRMTNDYVVEVMATTPEDAIREAYNNQHEPGELTSNWNDGEFVTPSEWIVCAGQYDAEGQFIELPVERESLGDLD